MSKFDQCCFYGDYDDFAVSKEKYTKEQAVAVAIENLDPYPPKEWTLSIGDYWVRHRAGVNEDGEPCVGWWLEYEQHDRSCPVWAFHVTRYDPSHLLEQEYEHIKVVNGTAQGAVEEKK